MQSAMFGSAVLRHTTMPHAAGTPHAAPARRAAAPCQRAAPRARPVASSSGNVESAERRDTTLTGPPPQKFAVAEGQLLNIASAAFAAAARGGCGAFAAGYSSSVVKAAPGDETRYSVAALPFGYRLEERSAVTSFPRPAQPLVIYDLHGCPFCRKVREAVSILDLEVLFLPCPRDGPTWRPEAKAKSGKSQFPLLLDPNNGTQMLESDDIVAYLFATYGDGKVPLGLRLPLGLTAITAGLGMLPRAGRGSKYVPAARPALPLEFWQYEASPFCVVVREVLSELELAHVQFSVARGSPRRQVLFEQRGHFQAPFLSDPNTGVAMFESADIIAYLKKTYAA